MKSIEGTQNILVTTFLVFVTILVISTPVTFSQFKIAYAAISNPISIAPQAKLVYNNHKYGMSPFIFTDGGQLSKIQFPALPGDTNANLTVEQGNTINFQFSKQPIKIDAFITDYDGDIPTVHPLKNVGPSAFQISGPLGIWQIEVHAVFPGNHYASFTTLANVQGNSINSQSLTPQASCGAQNRLQIAGVTDSNNNNSNTLVNTLNNGNTTSNNPVPMWSATGEGSWVQLDLGQEKSICNLEIGFANGDTSINFFTIQTSTDGVHFVDHGSAQNTGMISGREQFSFSDTPIPARFVKLTFHGNTQGDIYNITDLKVIGS
ncbi:MAG TPA: discoidin domain-containing protein [Candidatus Nitrosopolaris sp.]|nr:discoidin domain-containing protein [Candidatus Nitrosopolaris sp.]